MEERRRNSPFVTGRTPISGQPIRGIPLRQPGGAVGAPGSVPGSVPGRVPGAVPGRSPFIRGTESLNRGLRQLSTKPEATKHAGVKPSLLNTQSVTSSGCNDLDKILEHQGIPLGSSILVEESGTTDFANVLSKVFVSQGIVHNRLDPQISNTHIILLTSNQHWTKELPGVFKGSSRDIKKQRVQENENKLSVQNLITGDSHGARSKDLKIAWRYGLNDQNKAQTQSQGDNNVLYKDYNHQFDITSRLSPGPGTNELTTIQISSNFKSILKNIEHVIMQHQGKVIRLLIPSFLNPSMYPPQLTSSHEALQFAHGLRSLTRKFDKLCIMLTLALDLYPRSTALVKLLESLTDSVIHLEPFNQEMTRFLEKAYHNQPTKVSHGLVHVYKIAHASERGQMKVTVNEYAFKNGRKKFEIEEWGIPVEDEGDDDAKKSMEF